MHRAPMRGPTWASAGEVRGPITWPGLGSWDSTRRVQAIAEHSNAALAILFRAPASPPPLSFLYHHLLLAAFAVSSIAMSNERAAFQAEVAEVERWWKVRLARSPLITVLTFILCRTLASGRRSGRTPQRRSCPSAARFPSPTPQMCRRRSSGASSRSASRMARLRTHMAREYMRMHTRINRDIHSVAVGLTPYRSRKWRSTSKPCMFLAGSHRVLPRAQTSLVPTLQV